MSECDRLNEEVKQMMDPMGVEIKRKEAVARQRIELAKTLEEADQRVRERLNKAQEDESSAV